MSLGIVAVLTMEPVVPYNLNSQDSSFFLIVFELTKSCLVVTSNLPQQECVTPRTRTRASAQYGTTQDGVVCEFEIPFV